jgi:Heparinase II/III-like protein
MLCALTGFTQVTERNILANKYSLKDIKSSLMAHGQWKPYPKTTTEWKTFLTDEQITTLIQAGELAMKSDIPNVTASMAMDFSRSGDRERHSKASFARRNMLTDLMIAESVEDKGRFTESIFALVWAICEESFWGVPAHIRGLPDVDNPTVDLFAAETASTLALADYLVGEKLDKISPMIRKRIYSETKKRIFEPIKTPEKYSYLSRTRPVNNWNPWIVSNLILSNLLLEKDIDKRAEALHQYMIYGDAYLNSLGDDGGCDEGPSYWFAAGACVFDYLEILENVSQGKINVYDQPLIKNMANYVYKVHITGDYFVNFADADPTLKADGLMLYRFGKAIQDPQMVQFGLWAYDKYGRVLSNNGFHRMRRLQNLMTYKRINSEKANFIPVKDAWINDIQVLTARANNGLYLATHGGHNAESHNHNDVGDFIVYANGEPVIVDAGRGNYTARTFSAQRYELWFTQSQNHNLPTINNLGQLAGRQYEATQVKSNITDKEAMLSMDIAASYDKKAGVQKWHRTVKLNRVKNQIEVADDYVLAQKPTSIHHAFITVCDININTVGKIALTTTQGQKLSIAYDPKMWQPSIEALSTDGMEYVSFKTKWDKRPVQRIVLTNKTLDQKGKYDFVVTMN